MDARLQTRIQRYGWDKAAVSYEQYWADQLLPAQTRLLAMAQLHVGEHVLDVACGTGLVTVRAAMEVGPRGTVVGTDLSDEMVLRLREEVHRRGLDHVTAVRADAEDLGIPSASCDVALCALGLMYVADPVAALREMWRVLGPHGRAVAAVWGARAQCGWAEIFPIVERRVASEVCPLFFQLGGGDALHYAFAAAGFCDVTVERITTVLAYDSADAACAAMFAGGPVALAYTRFDASTRDAAHTEYLQSIAAYRQGAGYAIPGEFVIARGSKVEDPKALRA